VHEANKHEIVIQHETALKIFRCLAYIASAFYESHLTQQDTSEIKATALRGFLPIGLVPRLDLIVI